MILPPSPIHLPVHSARIYGLYSRPHDISVRLRSPVSPHSNTHNLLQISYSKLAFPSANIFAEPSVIKSTSTTPMLTALP